MLFSGNETRLTFIKEKPKAPIKVITRHESLSYQRHSVLPCDNRFWIKFKKLLQSLS